jgi:SIR2-like domain/Effector-associated domain 11
MSSPLFTKVKIRLTHTIEEISIINNGCSGNRNATNSMNTYQSDAADEMNDYDWDDLLHNLEQQKCVLVLGPDLYINEGEAPLHRQLADFLEQQAEKLRIRVHDNGWFHLQPSGNETSPMRQVKAFYQLPRPKAEAMLSKLVRLRFPIFVSLTPDSLLRQAFEGQAADFEVYVRNKPYREDLLLPSADRPLVYQLLGSLEDRNSLVLTYDDFYDYLKSVFVGNSMSPILRDAIMAADYFLFLGMPFDQWYIHLFMRILNQTKEKQKTLKVAVPFNDTHAVSCAEQYTIKFVNNHITNFVNELLRRCESSPNARLLLRLVEDNPTGKVAQFSTLLEDLKRLAELDRFDDFYERVKNVLSGSGDQGKKLLLDFIQLKSRLSNLQNGHALGLIPWSEYSVEMNRIRKGFLDQLEPLSRILP